MVGFLIVNYFILCLKIKKKFKKKRPLKINDLNNR